jgi:hypothetical protein
MYPGGWIPERLYTPPRKKLKKRALKRLKELYEEAREIVPQSLQAGLLPAHVTADARARLTLPAPADIDFESLARSLETIRVLIAAVEAQREKIKRRRREEEEFLAMIVELL